MSDIVEDTKRKELYVSKQITEMPMKKPNFDAPNFKMSHNARVVLYTVLKKYWQNFRNNNKDSYDKDGHFIIDESTNNIKDFLIKREPIILTLSDLKPLFFKNATFKEISEIVMNIPLDARFNTYFDDDGKKQKELIDTKISLFTKIQSFKSDKSIKFIPSENLLIYLEALKSFARIDIEELKKLNGAYQIRGYEFICQYNYLDEYGNKLVNDEVRKVKVEDLRRYFEIPDNYNIGNIDQRVLNPVKKAINKHTKFNIINIKKFKLDKQNKNRVTHYRIDIEYKKSYLDEIAKKEDNRAYNEKQKNKITTLHNNDLNLRFITPDIMPSEEDIEEDKQAFLEKENNKKLTT